MNCSSYDGFHAYSDCKLTCGNKVIKFRVHKQNSTKHEKYDQINVSVKMCTNNDVMLCSFAASFSAFHNDVRSSQ